MKQSFVKSRWFVAASAAALSTTIASSAFAQDAEAGAAPASAERASQGGIADIIVTARRRNESLLETPVAVTAFSAEELERRSIQQVSEIQSSTPSLIYEGTGGNSSEARVFIRGVGNAIANVSSEQGVGIYIDGMFFARSQGAMLDNLDLASIEVLRGPQGTLFGKNTIGGAVNITTIKPSTDALSGQVEVGFGRYNRVRSRASLNIPLGDKLAVRIAGMVDRDDGYSVNDFNGRKLDNRDTWVASGALRFTPTDNLTWDVSAIYSADNNNGRAFQCIQITPHPVFGAIYVPACAATRANGLNHTSSDAPLTGAMEMFATSSTIAWDLGSSGVIDDFTIKGIAGYQWANSHRVIDYDATALNGIYSVEVDKQTHQISGELQLLVQAFDKKLNFVLGAYADRERTPGKGERFGSIYPFLEPARIFSNVQYLKLLNRSRAVYSQFTYDFNPIVSLTGGIRYSDDTKGFYTQKCAVRVAAPTTCVGPDQANGVFSVPAKTWTPMTSLQLNAPASWTNNGFLDQAMLYFTYSKGFKNGGFNANGTTTGGNLTSFKPEHVDNYEVGLKFSIFDRRLVGSVTRYDMSYKDIQLNVQSNNPDTGAPIASIFNAGAAKIQGIEVELQALLMETLRLSFNGDFTQPRYTRFDDLSAPGGTRVGEPLALIPKYRVSGSIENRFSLGGEMALTPRVQVTRTGDRYMYTSIGVAAREAAHAQAITVVDASLRYDVNDMLALDFYGKNIFNKRTINDGLSFGDHVITWYSAPTTYGVTARMKF